MPFLLLAPCILMTNRYYSILAQPWNTIFSLVLLKIIQTPAAVALILCIVGATSADTPAQIESESTVHIGVILFTVVYVALVVLTLGSMLGRRVTGRGELSLILAVSLALPFLGVRVLYALLEAFSHEKHFNPATGSTTIALFMDEIQEMIVVLIYLVAAIKTPAIPPATNGEKRSAGGTLAYRAGRGDFGTGKLGLLSLAAAVGQAFSNNQRGSRGNGHSGQQNHRGRRSDGYPSSGARGQQTSAV